LLRHRVAVRQPASQPVIKEMPGSVVSGTPIYRRALVGMQDSETNQFHLKKEHKIIASLTYFHLNKAG
jgi:hypothetical protein